MRKRTVTRKKLNSTTRDEVPLYSVATMDGDGYTPQAGLSVPSFNITLYQLRIAIRELREMGYGCHRVGNARDGHEDFSPCTAIMRTDGLSESAIRKRFLDW